MLRKSSFHSLVNWQRSYKSSSKKPRISSGYIILIAIAVDNSVWAINSLTCIIGIPNTRFQKVPIRQCLNLGRTFDWVPSAKTKEEK
jgi:hypothetical protein